MNEELTKIIDELIEELSTSDNPPSPEVLGLVGEIEVLARLSKQRKADNELLTNKLDEIVKAISESNNEVDLSSVVSAIEKIKIDAPQVNVEAPKVTVTPTAVHVPPIQVPETVIPPVVVPPLDLTNLEALLEKYMGQPVTIEFPKKAKDPISVRLSDGEQFYRALGGVAQSVSALDNRANFANDLDDSTTDIIYVGRQDRLGAWSVMKVDETGSTTVITYASLKNNDDVLYPNYPTAWNKRASLNYTIYSEAF